mmetsp:Transcript_118701/g.378479  ORF Transcript_118701/g.378479 Transcript_118701/m.378479 type:complete len:249 (+) Transcript_118701:94-840(+)
MESTLTSRFLGPPSLPATSFSTMLGCTASFLSGQTGTRSMKLVHMPSTPTSTSLVSNQRERCAAWTAMRPFLTRPNMHCFRSKTRAGASAAESDAKQRRSLRAASSAASEHETVRNFRPSWMELNPLIRPLRVCLSCLTQPMWSRVKKIRTVTFWARSSAQSRESGSSNACGRPSRIGSSLPHRKVRLAPEIVVIKCLASACSVPTTPIPALPTVKPINARLPNWAKRASLSRPSYVWQRALTALRLS